jgi:hypothetical protein
MRDLSQAFVSLREQDTPVLKRQVLVMGIVHHKHFPFIWDLPEKY